MAHGEWEPMELPVGEQEFARLIVLEPGDLASREWGTWAVCITHPDHDAEGEAA